MKQQLDRLATLLAARDGSTADVSGLLGPLAELRLAAFDAGASDEVARVEQLMEMVAGAADEPAAAAAVQAIAALLADLGVNVVLAADEPSAIAAAEPEPEPDADIETIPLPAALEDEELLVEFLVEADEHLTAADTLLLHLERDHDDIESLHALFRGLHTIKGLAGFLELEAIGTLAHAAESLLDAVRRNERVLDGIAIDAIFTAVDKLRAMVVAVERAAKGKTPLPVDRSAIAHAEHLRKLTALDKKARLGEILVAAGAVDEQTIDASIEQQKAGDARPLGTLLIEKGVAAKQVAQGLRAQRLAAERKQDEPAPSSSTTSNTIRVPVDRLDLLVDAIGELAIAQSMLSELARSGLNARSSRLQRTLAHVERTTRELHSLASSMRMVPLRRAFDKLARVARDAARRTGKEIDFCCHGEETELDKKLVEAIGDPLLHIVRNAVGHGIEPEVEQRRTAGKPDAGKVTLTAFHRGGSVFIEVSDDGRGLSRERILKKARSQGIVDENANLSEDEIYQLILRPGFSTAPKVTDLSGRGVGLDVVKRTVDSLGGALTIRSTEGKGSTFSLRLPLTLAVMDGMVVRIGNQRYAIPLLSMVRSVRPAREDVHQVVGCGELVSIRGQLVPLVRLAQLFNIRGAAGLHEGFVVQVEDDGQQAGLLVDELLGQQQIVVKTLGDGLGCIDAFAGGAILPDGRVGLILEVGAIIRASRGYRRAVTNSNCDTRTSELSN
ncbi:MAG: chemotaxis protein CheA [Myxococcales bacterium]|nr:chemotaxis protein CheA [Myxococcales bacterium]